MEGFMQRIRKFVKGENPKVFSSIVLFLIAQENCLFLLFISISQFAFPGITTDTHY